MFMHDEKQNKWWYRCEECGAETEKRNDHETPNGLEGWHVDKYRDIDIHICPKCQASGKAPK